MNINDLQKAREDAVYQALIAYDYSDRFTKWDKIGMFVLFGVCIVAVVGVYV